MDQLNRQLNLDQLNRKLNLDQLNRQLNLDQARADAHGHRGEKSSGLDALLLIARSTRERATLPRTISLLLSLTLDNECTCWHHMVRVRVECHALSV